MRIDPQKSVFCNKASESPDSMMQRLSDATEKIVESCGDPDCFSHIDYEPIPSVESVNEILDKLKEVIFPGYFNNNRMNPINLRYKVGQAVSSVYDLLAEQIANSIRHDCFRFQKECENCRNLGVEKAVSFLEQLPTIRKELAKDVEATFDGDPSARSYDEIIFSYPGIMATTIHRIAHALYKLDIPILPRTMSEIAHSKTGIDIHPGATIGERFVMDHGTGVVIGETTVIGNNVRIYQGVTLGAHSLPPDAGTRMKGVKRHPTIEDDVIVYAGATILGGETTIGARSIIGGNVWITDSVPADTKVVMETPRLNYIS